MNRSVFLRRALRSGLWIFALVFAVTNAPGAGSLDVFGPKSLRRTTAAPDVSSFTFPAAPGSSYVLRIDNHAVASAVVTLNGVQVLGPNDFTSSNDFDWRRAPDWNDPDWKDNDNVDCSCRALILRKVTLRASNTLRIELRSMPGSHLSVAISGADVDTIPPTITASATPPPNAAGWNNTDVQVQFACADAQTGLASCTPPRQVTTEGQGQVVTGTASDRAGNTSTASVTLNIDKSVPAINVRVLPAPDALGVIDSDATLTFTCSDQLSGISLCPAPIHVTTEGANQTFSGTATDVAGNQASASVTVNIQKSRPTITAQATPAPNASGWNQSDVHVTFVCGGSAPEASCPAAVTVTTEGSNQVVSRTVTDAAGHTATASVTLNIDKTAPTVMIASPASGAVLKATPVAMTGAVSDSLSGVASITCNGDAAPVGGSVSCSAALHDGSNTLSITATDAAGNVGSAHVDVTFAPSTSNHPPIANAGSGYSGAVNAQIAFSAAGSSDPDGDSLSYAWTFGDGGTATGASPSHAYAHAGTYQATLTITDTQSASASATANVNVFTANRAPTANAGGPYSGVAGTPVTFSASASDPDNDPLSFAWDFGDGTQAVGATVSHVYAAANAYSVVVTASDGNLFATATTTAAIAAANRGPVVSAGGPYSGLTGATIAFAATASDPDNDTIFYTWDFGDGGSGSGRTPSHAFASPGNYTVTVTADDHRGGIASATAAVAIAQANRAPHASAGGPYAGNARTRVLFSAIGSSDPDGDPLTYAWNFGDGTSGAGVAPNHGYATEGTYTVKVTVDDGHGGTDVATTTVAVTPLPPPVNSAPIARPGGPYAGETNAVVTFNGALSSDADGDALTFRWDFGDGGTAAGAAATHVYASAGTYTVVLAVDDGQGHQVTATTSAAIAAAPDRVPPHVSISAPSKVLPGTTVTITAAADDNVGVTSVTFAVDGAVGPALVAPPYQRAIDVPAVAAPGSSIHVRATARDAASNVGIADATLTIDAVPDTENPTVTAGAPLHAAPGSIVHLTASASDNVGIASVTFSVDGAPIATVPSAPYEATYTIPAGSAVGSTITLSVRATDFTGNHADAVSIVSIAAAADTTPPVVTMAAPTGVAAGETLALSATATDDVGVASVAFYVNDLRIAVVTQAPFTASYPVPSTAVAGSLYRLEARALDFSGNEGHATADALVASSTQALAVGQVLDASTGLLLPGATVNLTGVGVSGQPFTQSTVTDGRGRFTLQGLSGRGVLRVTAAGTTEVDRAVDLQTGVATRVLDARLTPLAAPSAPVSGVLGGAASNGAASLTLQAGVAAADLTLALTSVPQQGIQGVLPGGWSPASVVDVTPHGTAIAGSTLTLPNRAGLAAGASYVVARWDDTAAAWRDAGTATVSPDGATVQATIDTTGQFAIVVADTVPSQPSQPAAGELLTGTTPAAVPADAVSVVTPQPKIVIYQPGVRSDVTGTLAAAAPLPSGTRITSRVSESYRFWAGGEVHPEPFSADVLFYQQSDPLKQRGTFTVSPSYTFEPLALKDGVITVALYAPADVAAAIPMVGPDGAVLTAPTGESVSVPAGATPDARPMEVAGLSETTLGAPLPDGLTFVGGVLMSFTGSLSFPATLSTLIPASLTDSSGLFLVRLAEIQGQTRFVLVGVGRIAGNRIVSDVTLQGTSNVFDGIRAAGRYAFVRATALTAFAAGTVVGTGGAPFAGALVSTPTLPIVALSSASGGYIAAGAVLTSGSTTFTAKDLNRSDAGSNAVTFAQAGEVRVLDLHLVAQPPTVTSITPPGGSTNVALATAIVVTFSEPIDPATISGGAAANLVVTADGGTVIPAALALTSGNAVATLRPTAALASNATYTVHVATGIKNPSGYALKTAVTSTFTTLDTAPPAPPPAGAITASIPSNGSSTVHATQGTAGVHDTVTITNLRTGQVNPVLVDPNGGFTVTIDARTSDKLRLRIVDAAGNTTTVELARFSQANPDGSISASVGADGGHVDGPAGTAIDVPQGAFPDGTIVRIRAIDEGHFPVSLTADQRNHVAFAGGVELDFGGAQPAKYINVSIPPGPGDKPGDAWVVSAVVDTGSGPALSVVDTAKLINGRVTTSSPPCPGVTGAAVYGIHKLLGSAGLNYGVMVSQGYGTLVMKVDTPFLDFMIWPLSIYAPAKVAPVCLPVLSGRVTVVENSQQLALDGSEIRPGDVEFIVSNSTRGTEFHFPHNIVQYSYLVAGAATDSFRAFVVDSVGVQTPLADVRVTPGATGTVLVAVDLDAVTEAITSVIVRNLTTQTNTTFPVSSSTVRLDVAGGAGDTFTVRAVSATGHTRFVNTSSIQSPFGTGNLVAKAVNGAIDPTRAEIVAYDTANHLNPGNPGYLDPSLGRSAVYLQDDDAGTRASPPNACVIEATPSSPQSYANFCLEIPASRITNGGFAYPFDGDKSHQFTIRVFYEDGRADQQKLPNFRITVVNSVSGRVVRTIQTQAPPPGTPINFGTISDDTTAPLLTSGPSHLGSFDPSAPLTFGFSEALSPGTENGLIVQAKDASGNWITISGTAVLSLDRRSITFVPAAALRPSTEYRVIARGNDAIGLSVAPGAPGFITDAAGNSIVTQIFTIKTFEPRLVGHLYKGQGGRNLEPVKDVAITKKTIAGAVRTLGLAITDTAAGYQLLTLDTTDPPTAFEASAAQHGIPTKKRILLVPGVDHMPLRSADLACDPVNKRTSFTGDLAIISSWNNYYSLLTFYDVTNPLAPCLMSTKILTVTPDLLTPFDTKGTVHQTGFVRGITVLQHTGGWAAYAAVGEVGLMAADIGQDIPEYSLNDRVAEAVYPGNYIDVVAVNDRLAAIETTARSLDIFDPNLSLLTSLALPDAPRRIVFAPAYSYRAGASDATTISDLLFIAGDHSVMTVDITNPSSPTLIGSIAMPGIVRELDVDAPHGRLFAGGEKAATVGAQALYMLDITNPAAAAVDDNNDGVDDRIVWQVAYPAGVNGIRVESSRGLVYVGKAGIQATATAGLDIWSLYNSCCDLSIDALAQPEPAQTGYKGELLQKELQALKQAIASGLAKLPLACPGVTPSRLTILEQGSGACLWKDTPAVDCGDNYQPGISDHDFEVFVPASLAASADCVVATLNGEFRDDAGDPKPIVVGSGAIAFDDISFFPVPREEFESARLNILPPNVPSSADSTGDLGLGRQQLLLKWLLEGMYVKVPGLDAVRPDLETILGRLTDPQNGISPAEGYEWGTLQEYAFAKSGAFARVAAESDPASAFHARWSKTLHDAGKAGIRATLARMVADTAAKKAVLNITRASYDETACLDIQPGVVDPLAWANRPCTSFEDYVASVAARTVKDLNLTLFTPATVTNVIQRFYRIKSDAERVRSEGTANAFFATTEVFIKSVQSNTLNAYMVAKAAMPPAEATQRQSNVTRAVAKINEARTGASIHAVPHVANRGFRNASQVGVAMFKADIAGASPTPLASVALDLAGGETGYLKYRRNADGTIAKDPFNRAIKLFTIPVNQDADFGNPHGVAFTIDLPGKTIKEAFRQNNLGGFFYYVLDRTTAAVPPVAPQVPLPLPDPSGTLLSGDAECDDDKPLVVTWTFVDSTGKNIVDDEHHLGFGETVTVRLQVTNAAGHDITSIVLNNPFSGSPVVVGTLAPGQTFTKDILYTAPTSGQTIEGTLVATSSDGIVAAPPQQVIVDCEPFVIVPLMDEAQLPADPAIRDGVLSVELGGQAIRHFRLISSRSKLPKSGATVRVQTVGATGSNILTFTTNADGLLMAPGAATPGLVLPFTDVKGIGGKITATILDVDGVGVSCAPQTTFDLKLLDRGYRQTVTAGVGIDGSASLIAGVAFNAQQGIEVEKTGGYRDGDKDLSLKLSSQASIKTSVEFNILPDGWADVGVLSAKIKSTLGTSETRGTSVERSFKFNYTQPTTSPGPTEPFLTDNQKCAFASIALQQFVSASPLVFKLLDLVRQDPCGNATQYLTGTATQSTQSAKDSFNFGLTVASPLAIDDQNVAITAGADGGQGFAIATKNEQSWKWNDTAPELTGLKESYTLTGTVDFTAGLSTSLVKPWSSAKQQDQDKVTVDKITGFGAKQTSGGTVEGGSYAITFSYPPSHVSASVMPSSIAVTMAQTKNFGWKGAFDGGGPGANLGNNSNTSIKYTLARPEDITAAVGQLANIEAIQSSHVQGELGVQEIGFVPTILNQETQKFRGLLFQTVSTYEATRTEGSGIELPFGLKAKWLGIGLGLTFTAKSDSKATFPVERGVNFKGLTLPLQTYGPDTFSKGADMGLGDVIGLALDGLATRFAAEFSDISARVNNALTTLKSNFTATMVVDGSREPAPFDAGLFSYRFRPIAGPVRESHYAPGDTAGPAASPHYGIGSFHHFTPDGYQLAVPTPLTIDFKDEEVAGIDKSTLAIYGWNKTTNDWDYVGGVFDASANTVTANVQTFRTYTLAPPMPARTIDLTLADLGMTGQGSGATRRIGVTSGALVMNTGQPVPDGTLYTVKSLPIAAGDLTPYGTIFAADADPVTDGVQVASVGGRITFDVVYASPNGAYVPGRIVVYATRGTAFGQKDAIVVPQP